MRTLNLLVLAVLVVSGGLVQAGEPFRFVALPDTQVYAENRFPGDGEYPAVTDPCGTAYIFNAQTQWVVDHAEALNIRYVAHLGDIVENGSDPGVAPAEWARAKAAMTILLDADIPHGTVMGNHDDNHGADYMADYLTHFGPQVFEGRSWYVESSPSGGGNFQLLEHEGRKIGFINFSIDQPQEEIDWANRIIAENRDVLFIIGTHRYMWDYKLVSGRYGENVDSAFGSFNVREDANENNTTANTGEELYDEVVAANPNVLMIHAGHFHSEWLRVDPSLDLQTRAIEILTDYQDARNGGDGYLRIYTIDFDTNTFSFETWSPTLERYRTTMDHFVETIVQVFAYKEQVKEDLELSEEAFQLLLKTLKDIAPDVDLLSLHPDLDTQEARDYYEQLLSDMFLGEIPADVGTITDWEGLWLAAFAADVDNPFDFRSGYRSPSGSLQIDFDAFVCEHDLLGDINGDCRVDIVDFTLLATNWLIDCDLTPDDPECVLK